MLKVDRTPAVLQVHFYSFHLFFQTSKLEGFFSKSCLILYTYLPKKQIYFNILWCIKINRIDKSEAKLCKYHVQVYVMKLKTLMRWWKFLFKTFSFIFDKKCSSLPNNCTLSCKKPREKLPFGKKTRLLFFKQKLWHIFYNKVLFEKLQATLAFIPNQKSIKFSDRISNSNKVGKRPWERISNQFSRFLFEKTDLTNNLWVLYDLTIVHSVLKKSMKCFDYIPYWKKRKREKTKWIKKWKMEECLSNMGRKIRSQL